MQRHLRNLVVVYRPIEDLKPSQRNARTHSNKQIHQIAGSIEQFGFTQPILTDEAGTIICGHGRLEAAKLLKFETVPTIQIEHMSDAQRHAYMIADNKLALNAGWDPDILAIEFQHLSTLDLDFDLDITGFDTAEIDLLVDGQTENRMNDPADQIPAVSRIAVTQPGDCWTLGEHKLICGDARDESTYTALLEAPARVVFADPPYNVPIDGHVCGLGKIKHREFAMASGEMTRAEFTTFLQTVFRNTGNHSIDGAINFICMDWRHVEEVINASKGIYSELKNICVWNKDNGGLGSLYRSKHEFVFVFKAGNAPHINTIELGKSGRYRTNVWDYAGVNTMRPGRLADLASHPTVKPTAMVVDAIRDCSKRNDIVLDPFGGSGTTIVAAHKSGRRARVIEIDPIYVDVAIRRWQALTGSQAVFANSGRTFSDVASDRSLQDITCSTALTEIDAPAEDTGS